MRFGVNCSRTCRVAQGAFAGGLGDGRIDAGEIYCPCSRKSLGKDARPCCVARPTLHRRNDGASDKPGSAGDFVRETTRDAETDDRGRPAREFALKGGDKR